MQQQVQYVCWNKEAAYAMNIRGKNFAQAFEHIITEETMERTEALQHHNNDESRPEFLAARQQFYAQQFNNRRLNLMLDAKAKAKFYKLNMEASQDTGTIKQNPARGRGCGPGAGARGQTRS